MKEKILECARGLYNEHGMSHVTARIICKELKISPGSFSYHFKDKSLIIRMLYKEMLLEMKGALGEFTERKPGITVYLDMHFKLFQVQEKYRFFYLNLNEILARYEDIRTEFLGNVQQELEMGRAMIHSYVEKGILRKDIEGRTLDRLIRVGRILYNFWTLDAAIMPPLNEHAMRLHYLNICCGLLEPYLEPESLREYRAYFDQLEKEAVRGN
ncbi:MAG: TetR/AcrR family transcriptional regulator [Bacteroidia bacterium]|nr:TetR/AcrR family transcriptional regulator [Bacteroidia bacterium]